MIELFPEMELTEDSDYFKKIPPSTFDDKNIIEQYGKKLRELRTERGCSLQRVADYIGVDFQAISQVEKVSVRKSAVTVSCCCVLSFGVHRRLCSA